MERTYTLGEIQNALAYLDNGIPESCEIRMKRMKLPIPEEYGGGWVSGFTLEDTVQRLVERVRGQFKTVKDSPTFDEYAESWFLIKMAENRAESTLANYRAILNTRIKPFFGNKRIAEITPDDIQMYFNSIMHLSRSFSNQSKAILSGIFERACRNGFVEKNPMQFHYEHSNKAGHKIVLQDEDLISVIQKLDQLGGKEHLYVCFLCFTSLRRGEILGLKWGDIGPDEICVKRGISFPNGSNQPIIGHPKDESSGVVHLQSELAKRIEPFRKKPNEYVIAAMDNPTKPLTRTMFMKMWNRIRRTIDLKGATSHSFRATYVTMMNAHCQHIDPKALQGALRHKTPDLAMKVYTRQNTNKTKLAEEEYDEWIRSQLSQTS